MIAEDMNPISRATIIFGLSFVFTEAAVAAEPPPRAEAITISKDPYPRTRALGIPYWGTVTLQGDLPDIQAEYWIPVDHLIKDNDFHHIEILVDHRARILGGRGRFKGTSQEWRGDRGYSARMRVVAPLKDPENPFPKTLPLAIHNPDFGDLVFVFDLHGVSWRRAQRVLTSKQDRSNQHTTDVEPKPEE